ncbi:hypothetical protein CEXT_475301 [Caerostris extrusa]|uniref:Uncharacterized protein n=1 Tax=Caerostris extrusa TaxID=172846 RepID=A0AAV4STT7_CAEEX|nr:hypothetical protein CEXT_475301 [Caerostris extrusa]
MGIQNVHKSHVGRLLSIRKSFSFIHIPPCAKFSGSQNRSRTNAGRRNKKRKGRGEGKERKRKPITQWDTFYLPLVCPGGVPYEDWIVPSLLRRLPSIRKSFPFIHNPESAKFSGSQNRSRTNAGRRRKKKGKAEEEKERVR